MSREPELVLPPASGPRQSAHRKHGEREEKNLDSFSGEAGDFSPSNPSEPLSPVLTLLSPLHSLSLHSLYSGERRARMEQDWARAHLPFSLATLLNATVLGGLILGLVVLLFSGLIFGDWTTSILLFCTLFALFLAAGFYLPLLMAQRFARSAESDLPLALRSLALYLSIKMPMEKALARLSQEDYASAPLWRMMSHSIEGGESVPRAIAQAASSVSSMPFSRAAGALITYYEEGGGPEPLVSLAEELGTRQLSSLREEAAKAGVGGLLFVAISSVLPAFALVLMVAAGPLLDLPADPTSIWLLFALLLPIADGLVLLALLAGAPGLGGTWRPGPLAEAVSQRLAARGLSGFGWKQALLAALLIGLVAFLFSQLLPLSGLTLRLGLILALSPLLFIALIEGDVLAQVSSLEAELPSLLLGAASTGRFSIERLLEQSQNLPAGPLREQARAASRQIKAGGNPLTVLNEWAAHTPSVMLSRALTLLAVGWRAGGSMSKPLRALANDALSSGALVRERAAQMATQRYTLWAAGALLVPAILAVSLSFSAQVASMGTLSLSGAGLGAASSGASGAFSPLQSVQAAEAAVPVYLVLNSLLVGLYLALSSGARERFIPYAAAILICSQLVWMVLAPGA
ncbi:Type II secretion system (T2SS), protein F [uncultured archaeon]|nr:Type II secretion system (T2SS), protein F [uncultured archaeon]